MSKNSTPEIQYDGGIVNDKFFFDEAFRAIKSSNVNDLKNLLEESYAHGRSYSPIYGKAYFDDASARRHDVFGRSWLAIAVDVDASPDTLIFLANNGASVNARDEHYRGGGNTPLIHAAKLKHNKSAAVLLELGANPNASNESETHITPLMVAVEQNNVDTAKILLEHDANANAVDAKGRSVLFFASTAEMGDLLVRWGANVNYVSRGGREADHNPGDTPLMIALRDGNDDLSEFLINNGADISAKDQCGATPLMIAVLNANEKMSRMLISRGADVNATDKSGDSPLFHAVYSEKFEKLVPILVEAGANPWHTNKKGANLLIHTIDAPTRDVFGVYDVNGMVNFTLEQKLVKNIFHRDSSGNNALMLAISRNQSDVVKRLILEGFAGDHINKPNRKKITPVQLAIECGNALILTMLIVAGADISKVNPEWDSLVFPYINTFKDMDVAFETFFLLLPHGNYDSKEESRHMLSLAQKVAFHISEASISQGEKETFALLAALSFWPLSCKELDSIWKPVQKSVLNNVLQRVYEHVPGKIPSGTILHVLSSCDATQSGGKSSKKEYFIIEDSKAQSVMCSAVLDVLETNPGLAVRFFKNKIGKQLDTWVQDGVVEAEKLMTKMVSCFKKNKKTSHANTINGQFLDF